MKLILHGMFARDYGTEVVIEAGTVSEAIEGFTRQVGFYADRIIELRPIVRVLGYDTAELLQGPCADAEVHLVPAMFGGGGNFGKILIGLAVVGLMFIPGVNAAVVGTLVSAGLTAATAAGVAAGIIISGLGIALMGAAGIFIKAPTVNKSADPAASKYLGAAELTSAIGTPITYCLGRVKAIGQVLSFDVTANSLSTGTFP